MTAPGRVHVVHGDLTRLACDDVLIPTDADLRIEDPWRSLVTEHEARAAVSERLWGEGGMRACVVSRGTDDDPRRVWVVEVGSWQDRPLEWYLDGVVAAFAALGERAGGPRLVALPLIGTGEGGLARRRGELITGLLDVLDEQARTYGIDVALVTWTRSDYAAVQAVRAERDTALDPRLEAHARRIAGEAVEDRLVLFLGAGVSAAAGLPAWWELLERLAGYGAEDLHRALPEVRGETASEVLRAELRSLGTLDAAELLRKALGPAVVEAVARELQQDRYSLTHALLASLRTAKTITTNYDRLYELAAARPFAELGGLAVLPWDAAERGRPWLLKMHGDVDRPESIVLSRGDFAEYDASRRPLGSLLQAQMMTGHLLFVGSSMTDDNVLRLAHEVRQLRAEWCATSRPVGTVLTLADEPLRRSLWEGTLDFVLVGASGEPSADGNDTRLLQAFLDRVSVLASVERSYLLDPTYDAIVGRNATLRDALASLAKATSDLPEGSDERVVEQVRGLLARLGWSG
ncbi:MAG: SIR2 family protein [Actinomycetota bacterium]|nr:SIR2 family protein [Actinomycetota bacterium]